MTFGGAVIFRHQASVSIEWLVHDDSILVSLRVSRSVALELLEQIQACFPCLTHKQTGTEPQH